MSKRMERVSAMEYLAVIENAKRNKAFVAEIDGKDIQCMEDYLTAVWEAFRFPKTGHVNYYAYLDWIRDLDWLGADAYLFAIRNFVRFMEKAPKERDVIIRSLENTVMPWWESGIEQYQAGGKAKPFHVYLVE